MEIAKPSKVGRMEEMTPEDFTLHSIDLGEARHDTKVGLWRSGNEIIENQLEDLKLSKIRMKSEIEELKRFIRQLVVPLATITGVPAVENPMAEEVQAFISQLQKDRHFGEIGREWTDKINTNGLSLIDQIGNVALHLEKEKDNITANQRTLVTERERCEECISLLKMIIQMKAKEAVEVKILRKGNEPLFEWLQGMQFRLEMILEAEKGLKETEEKIKKTQSRSFELLKDLHSEPQTSGQGEALIKIDVMKSNFSVYLNNLLEVASSSQDRVTELQILSGCIHVATTELTSQLNSVKELAREHSR